MSRATRIAILAATLAVAVALGIGDVSSYLPELTAFVLVPVIAATYFVGFRYGVLVAVVAAASELITHVLVETGPHTEVIANTLSHTIIYVLSAALLDRLVTQLRITTRLEQQRSNELEIAKRVHGSVFTKVPERHGSLSIGSRVAFARELGGDYYHVHSVDSQLLFCIADISGKGTAAALFTSQLNQGVMGSLESTHDLTAMVESVNSLMYSTLPDDMFVTMFCALIDDGAITFVNVGHPPPLLYSAAAGEVRQLRSHGALPLGIEADLRIEASSVPFASGDVFLATTDGITDSAAFREHPYEKLESMLAGNAGKDAQPIADAIFTEAVPEDLEFPFDDAVVLCIKRD